MRAAASGNTGAMNSVTVKRALILAAALLLPAGEALALQKTPPYWASIVPGQARTRTGPGRNYPAMWMYQRRGLPVRVVAVFPAWRKVEDPDGAQGWMQANMLSDDRMAMVRGGEAALRTRPEAGAPIAWRAADGVIGRLRACADGWCELDIAGRRGWVETGRLWGVAADERLNR
jgi:SH3-like domain-containing protein